MQCIAIPRNPFKNRAYSYQTIISMPLQLISENCAIPLQYHTKPSINVKIWDITEGKTDEELKLLGIYNNDLEDFFRKINLATILKNK